MYVKYSLTLYRQTESAGRAYYVVVDDGFDASVQVLTGEQSVMEVVVDGCVRHHLCYTEPLTWTGVSSRTPILTVNTISATARRRIGLGLGLGPQS